MSEHLLKILVSELVRVRLICRKPHCGAVTEVAIPQMRVALSQHRCPVCGTSLVPPVDPANPDRPDYLRMLATAIEGLTAAKEQVGVEFVLPVED